MDILAGLCLAASAGLNAYLPLLILALAGRFGKLALPAPYHALSEWLAIFIILLPVTVELMLDKIPGWDSRNDRVATIIRPLAGALLFLAYNAARGEFVSPVVAGGLGLLAAAAVHALKMTTRPLVTLATRGYANALVSLLEDIVAAGVAVLAIFAPVVAALLLLPALAALYFLQVRLRPAAALARARLLQKTVQAQQSQP